MSRQPGLFDDDDDGPSDIDKMTLHGQPETSRQAAEHILLQASEIKIQVAAVLFDHGGLTDAELNDHCVARYGLRAESSYRKRRTDLADAHLVYDTGERRFIKGEWRAVWALTDHGREVFAVLRPRWKI